MTRSILIVLTLCLLLSGCNSNNQVGRDSLLSQFTIEDSFNGYQGVWLVYKTNTSIQACDLREYRNGTSLKEIMES